MVAAFEERKRLKQALACLYAELWRVAATVLLLRVRVRGPLESATTVLQTPFAIKQIHRILLSDDFSDLDSRTLPPLCFIILPDPLAASGISDERYNSRILGLVTVLAH